MFGTFNQIKSSLESVEVPKNILVLDGIILAYPLRKDISLIVNNELLQSTKNPSTEHESILED